MAKETHRYDHDKGRMISGHVVKGQNRVDPLDDVHTFTEGPISRLLNRRRR